MDFDPAHFADSLRTDADQVLAELREDVDGAFYHAGYADLSVAGLDGAGGEVAVVGGKHEQNYPYFDPRSKWDSVLVHARGLGFALSARELPNLQVSRAGARVTFAWHEDVTASDGRPHRIDLDLAFSAAAGKVYDLGRPYPFLDKLPWVGMRWQPFALTLDAGVSRLAVDGQPVVLARLAGEIEEGHLDNLKLRPFAFRYDYRCYTHPSTGDTFVDVVTRALRSTTLLERAIDWYGRTFASVQLTMSAAGHFEAGNPRGLGDAVEVLVEDRVELGLARLDRQLVRARDAAGAGYLGLREIFHPTE